MPELLLLLLALPLVTAIVVALLGPGRAAAVRWISLASVARSVCCWRRSSAFNSPSAHPRTAVAARSADLPSRIRADDA